MRCRRPLWRALFAAAAAAFVWFFATVACAQQSPPSDAPEGIELPVEVRLAVRVLRVVRLQEIQSELAATVEFTQQWTDPGVRFDRLRHGDEHMDFVGPAAEAQLARMWSPDAAIENIIGSPVAQTVALSIFWDGRVVLVRTMDAVFRVHVDMGGFPFDRQRLPLSFIAPRHAANVVVLTTTELDRRYSTVDGADSAVNWTPRSISFRQESFFGWNARPFSRLTATLTLDRRWPSYILRLFIPFAAVMSLSLFLLWVPRSVLSNAQRAPMVFSGLLALAALSFTFETSFPGSMSMNSPVAFMISIGYFYLPFVLMIDTILGQDQLAFARRFPFLLPEIRRNVRVTVPLLFFALCLISMLIIGDGNS